MLQRVHVHLRPWKVGQSAGVVQVEVGQHDVPDVLHRETEPDDLPGRRLCRIAGRAKQGRENAHERCRSGIVPEPKTGIDQQESVVRLDE
jgi:hypothetical protein